MEIALDPGMRNPAWVARRRAGFTLIELLMVIIIGGIAGTIAVPSISRSLAQNRAHSAASLVAADMQLAHSMAARQRRPVTIQIIPASLEVRVFDTTTPSNVYSSRLLGEVGGHLGMKASVNQVTIFPTGLSSQELTVQLGSGGARRTISMTRAGQVRVKAS